MNYCATKKTTINAKMVRAAIQLFSVFLEAHREEALAAAVRRPRILHEIDSLGERNFPNLGEIVCALLSVRRNSPIPPWEREKCPHSDLSPISVFHRSSSFTGRPCSEPLSSVCPRRRPDVILLVTIRVAFRRSDFRRRRRYARKLPVRQ